MQAQFFDPSLSLGNLSPFQEGSDEWTQSYNAEAVIQWKDFTHEQFISTYGQRESEGAGRDKVVKLR